MVQEPRPRKPPKDSSRSNWLHSDHSHHLTPEHQQLGFSLVMQQHPDLKNGPHELELLHDGQHIGRWAPKFSVQGHTLNSYPMWNSKAYKNAPGYDKDHVNRLMQQFDYAAQNAYDQHAQLHGTQEDLFAKSLRKAEDEPKEPRLLNQQEANKLEIPGGGINHAVDFSHMLPSESKAKGHKLYAFAYDTPKQQEHYAAIHETHVGGRAGWVAGVKQPDSGQLAPRWYNHSYDDTHDEALQQALRDYAGMHQSKSFPSEFNSRAAAIGQELNQPDASAPAYEHPLPKKLQPSPRSRKGFNDLNALKVHPTAVAEGMHAYDYSHHIPKDQFYNDFIATGDKSPLRGGGDIGALKIYDNGNPDQFYAAVENQAGKPIATVVAPNDPTKGPRQTHNYPVKEEDKFVNNQLTRSLGHAVQAAVDQHRKLKQSRPLHELHVDPQDEGGRWGAIQGELSQKPNYRHRKKLAEQAAKDDAAQGSRFGQMEVGDQIKPEAPAQHPNDPKVIGTTAGGNNTQYDYSHFLPEKDRKKFKIVVEHGHKSSGLQGNKFDVRLLESGDPRFDVRDLGGTTYNTVATIRPEGHLSTSRDLQPTQRKALEDAFAHHSNMEQEGRLSEPGKVGGYKGPLESPKHTDKWQSVERDMREGVPGNLGEMFSGGGGLSSGIGNIVSGGNGVRGYDYSHLIPEEVQKAYTNPMPGDTQDPGGGLKMYVIHNPRADNRMHAFVVDPRTNRAIDAPAFTYDGSGKPGSNSRMSRELQPIANKAFAEHAYHIRNNNLNRFVPMTQPQAKPEFQDRFQGLEVDNPTDQLQAPPQETREQGRTLGDPERQMPIKYKVQPSQLSTAFNANADTDTFDYSHHLPKELRRQGYEIFVVRSKKGRMADGLGHMVAVKDGKILADNSIESPKEATSLGGADFLKPFMAKAKEQDRNLLESGHFRHPSQGRFANLELHEKLNTLYAGALAVLKKAAPPPIPTDALKVPPANVRRENPSPWDNTPPPAPINAVKNVQGKHTWLGRPILHADHAMDLETEAAVGEFGERMPRAEAEKAAYDRYVSKHRTAAAAHHLVGMRVAQTAGDPETAKKHALLYGLHVKALGHEPVGEVPKEIQAHHEKEPAQTYKFKAHKGDLYALHDK